MVCRYFPLQETQAGVLGTEGIFCIAFCTNSVVAICVLFVPFVAVGALGIQVNVGLAKSAFAFICQLKVLRFAFIAFKVDKFVLLSAFKAFTASTISFQLEAFKVSHGKTVSKSGKLNVA
ncbi:MAG: hypothetical protein LBQ24_05945 [Candidatus Peribacteria bacterium]|nr:hypothetical protein [Candidatus Peribacteria bacterium]